MNTATLQAFRNIAATMQGDAPQNWQWIGRHISQRMFGISELRAKDFAARFGGVAKQMDASHVTSMPSPMHIRDRHL